MAMVMYIIKCDDCNHAERSYIVPLRCPVCGSKEVYGEPQS